jgi:hypothetical protein
MIFCFFILSLKIQEIIFVETPEFSNLFVVVLKNLVYRLVNFSKKKTRMKFQNCLLLEQIIKKNVC